MADEGEPENDEEQEQRELIDRQIRTHKALQHMERELQLPTATVMPVLLKLMKAYDGKWEFIEADNYHVLVDTFFSIQESDEAEKAPGSSSGSGARKKREKKNATRGTPSRRAARNSKRAESEESEENDGSHELVHRIRARAPPLPIARPIASSAEAKRKQLVVVNGEDNDDDSDAPAPWDPPLLALPAPLRTCAVPQCQLEVPSGSGRRELRPYNSRVESPTAVSKQTQTEASCFHAELEPIQPTALICYQAATQEVPIPAALERKKKAPALICYEATSQDSPIPPSLEKKKAPAKPIVKREKEECSHHDDKETPVPFLSDSEVRRQILHQSAAPEICRTCDKPRVNSNPVRFDPSIVKVEGRAQGSGIDRELSPPDSMVCLNPEPLQALVPLPLPAEPVEDESPMEFHGPEPLLLTFPAATDPISAHPIPAPVAATEGPTTHGVQPMQGLVSCSESPAIEGPTTHGVQPVQGLVSCSENPAIDTTHAVEPKQVLISFSESPAIEEAAIDTLHGVQPVQGLASCSESHAIEEAAIDTTMEVDCQPVLVPIVEEFSSKVEVKEVLKTVESLHNVEELEPSGAGCENSTTDGALAALASYIDSESDHSDADIVIPEQQLGPHQLQSSAPVGEVINTSSCCPNEGVEQAKADAHRILPLANASSMAELHEQSKNTIQTVHVSPGVESRTVGNIPVANGSSMAELHEQSKIAIKTAHVSPVVESFPEQSRDAWVVVEVKQTTVSPAITTQHEEASNGSLKDTEMATPNEEERKQSLSGRTSSESTKKRKRTLIKLKDLEEVEQSCPVDHIIIPSTQQSRHDCQDISRGKEKVPITLARDAAGTKDLPAEFFYINASVVFQSAHVGISLARIAEDDRCSGCLGNCLDNRVPCECTRLTDGEYAYTVEGHLYPHFLQQELEKKTDMNQLSYCQPGACPVERNTDDVCKGHIQRRFIKECWEKCGCTQLCGNRIVQRGIVHRLQVFWTEDGKGWGLRTLEPLRAGTFVCEYVGEILSNTEMWERNNDVHGKAKHHFSLQLDADWKSEHYLQDEEALCLDGTCFGNVARFINHRCEDTNLIEIPVEIESPDHHYYHLAFFTSKDVKENEELTWDYGLDFNDKDHQIRAFECLCGSSLCRGKMEGKPWV